MALFYAVEELAVGGDGPGVVGRDRLHIVAGGAQRAHDGQHPVVQMEALVREILYAFGGDEGVLELAAEGVGRVHELGEVAERRALVPGPALGHYGPLGLGALGEAADKAADGGEYLAAGHGEGGLALDGDELAVLLLEDLLPRAQLAYGEDAVAGEELDVGAVGDVGQGLGRALEVVQPAAGGLLDPAGVIAVAVEDYAAVLVDDAAYERVEGGVEVLRLLELVGELPELLGDRGVEGDVARGDARRAARPGPHL